MLSSQLRVLDLGRSVECFAEERTVRAFCVLTLRCRVGCLLENTQFVCVLNLRNVEVSSAFERGC